MKKDKPEIEADETETEIETVNEETEEKPQTDNPNKRPNGFGR